MIVENVCPMTLTSERDLLPLMRVTIWGWAFIMPAIGPPSIFVVVVTVTSASSAADASTTSAKMARPRFMRRSLFSCGARDGESGA